MSRSPRLSDTARVSYPPVKAKHSLIDDATRISDRQKAFCLSAMQNVDNSPLRQILQCKRMSAFRVRVQPVSANARAFKPE
jgi:hypothetical protein